MPAWAVRGALVEIESVSDKTSPSRYAVLLSVATRHEANDDEVFYARVAWVEEAASGRRTGSEDDVPLILVMPQDARVAKNRGEESGGEGDKILVRISREKHVHEGRTGALVGINEARDIMHESDGVVKLSAFQFETVPLSELVAVVELDD